MKKIYVVSICSFIAALLGLYIAVYIRYYKGEYLKDVAHGRSKSVTFPVEPQTFGPQLLEAANVAERVNQINVTFSFTAYMMISNLASIIHGMKLFLLS